MGNYEVERILGKRRSRRKSVLNGWQNIKAHQYSVKHPGIRRGLSSENLALRVACDKSLMPSWLIEYASANVRDDRGGVDARMLVRYDIKLHDGTSQPVERTIKIQIKSSEGGRQGFLAKKTRDDIYVIVVPNEEKFSKEERIRKVIRELHSAYHWYRVKHLTPNG